MKSNPFTSAGVNLNTSAVRVQPKDGSMSIVTSAWPRDSICLRLRSPPAPANRSSTLYTLPRIFVSYTLLRMAHIPNPS